MKNSKSKLLVLILGVAAVAVAVSVILVSLLLDALKPTEFVITEPATGEGTGYYRAAYADLSESEKKVYSVVLASIYSCPEKIEIPSLDGGSLDKIFEALSYDNPDLFCLGLQSSVFTEGRKIYFQPEYTIDYETYAARYGELKKIASAIAESAKKYTSDYEKELFIHDYIINHCAYAETAEGVDVNSAYSCLVTGKASCEGYSRAFQYILSMLNIENRLVTGEAANTNESYVGHMWNYVVLDGAGYFTDITWDDPSTEGSVLRHTYFNVTTNDVLLRHRNIKQTLPLCTDTKYNFFKYENAFLDYTSAADFAGRAENVVFASIARGYKCAEIKFQNADIMAMAVKALFDDGAIYTIYSNAGIAIDKEKPSVYYSTDDSALTLCLYY